MLVPYLCGRSISSWPTKAVTRNLFWKGLLFSRPCLMHWSEGSRWRFQTGQGIELIRATNLDEHLLFW